MRIHKDMNNWLRWRRGSAFVVVALVVASLAGVASAKDEGATILYADNRGCTWAQATGSAQFGRSDTRDQVRAQAIIQARQRTAEKVLGIQVKSQLDIYQRESLRGHAQLIQDLLRMTQLGRIVDEKVLEERILDMPGCIGCQFQVRLQNCVMSQREQTDKGFTATLTLTAAGATHTVERTTFRHGEPMEVVVTASRDAYVYLYNIDAENNAVLLFPNADDQKNWLEAGAELRLPTGKVSGETYEARLPDGVPVAAEEMRVIVSKYALPAVLSDPTIRGPVNPKVQSVKEMQGGTLMALMAKLLHSDEEWVEDMKVFEITK